MKILVFNAGSSSHKSCLFELSNDALPEHPPQPIWDAHLDWTVKSGAGVLRVEGCGTQQIIHLSTDDRRSGIAAMLRTLIEGSTKVLEKLSEISIVGHRVVHGGSQYSQATPITPPVKAAIARLISLAPEHNPAALEGIEGIEQVLGEVPQVAVFDTAFHASMPTAVKIYPIPYEWFEKGIRRYGFHGTSHRYCAQRTAQLLGKPLASLKLVTCHLGNGCSLVAIRNGIGVDTTMGFTPLEGLMMGSRCGSIDPAILIYLQREHHFTTEQLSEMLNRQSGLKGVSGVSADLRAVLEARAKGNERAALAFDLFIHRLKAGVGSMITSLEGLDAITFTGGIGENSVVVREKVCQGFEFLGLRLDLTKNAGSPVDCDLAMPESTVRILTVHTQEHWAIAQECWHHALRMRGAF